MSTLRHIIFIIQIFFSLNNIIKLQGEMEKTVINAVNYVLSGPEVEIPKTIEYKKPKISIIIPVYNEAKYIKNVLKSIQMQSLKEIEIIFVDDKSTDKSVRKITRFQKEDPRIRLIKNKKNRGILYNRIYGGLQAKGKYIGFIDADDIYCNPNILEMAYDTCEKNKLDALEYDYYGGRYDEKTKEFLDIFLFSNQNKDLYDKVFYQPKIKKSFFYSKENPDIIAGIVYNKLYSHKLIERMADYIGEDFWQQHYIYMEDFIISLALARMAKSIMLLGYGGVYHWYENPEGMTKGVFDMDGKRLKYPEVSNKRLGDYLSMWERAFDLTENEPDSEYFRLKLIYLLKDPDNRHVFARTFHYERIIHLCKRMYTWKYSSKYAKDFAKQFAIETINFEVPIHQKYSESTGFDWDDDFISYNTQSYDTSKTKKKKEKKKVEKKKVKKKKNKEEIKIDDLEQIDGYIEGTEDL